MAYSTTTSMGVPTYGDAARRRIVCLPDGRLGVLFSIRGGTGSVRLPTGAFLGCRVENLRLADTEPLVFAREQVRFVRVDHRAARTYARALAGLSEAGLRTEAATVGRLLAENRLDRTTNRLAQLVAAEARARQLQPAPATAA